MSSIEFYPFLIEQKVQNKFDLFFDKKYYMKSSNFQDN